MQMTFHFSTLMKANSSLYIAKVNNRYMCIFDTVGSFSYTIVIANTLISSLSIPKTIRKRKLPLKGDTP